MTTETILTDDDLKDQKINLGVTAPDEFFNNVARAIEKAVLQSEQVQAWRRDAGRYQWLKKYADPLKGPAISTPEDGNHWLNGRIDGFIDAAMEQQA